MTAGGFAAFAAHQYVLLTTRRRNGVAVDTPVWFSLDGDVMHVRTGASSGKVKRLRSDDRVTLTPCDVRGRPRGVPVKAHARVVPASADGERAVTLLSAKYGWKYRLFYALRRARKGSVESAFLEIRLAVEGSGVPHTPS